MQTIISIFILFFTLSLNAFSQNDTIHSNENDTIFIRDNYVVWKNKTYNKIDKDSIKNGPWIYYTLDTLFFQTNGKKDGRYVIHYPVWSTGNYNNNKKNGKWTFYSSPYRIHSSVIYKDDIIADSLTIYSNSIVKVKGYNNNGQWTFVEWDEKIKKFVKPKHDYTLRDFQYDFRLHW